MLSILDGLISLPDTRLEFVTESMIKKILNADWYEIWLNGHPLPSLAFGPLFLPSGQIDLCGSGYNCFSPTEIGLNEARDIIEVFKVEDYMKKYSSEDGFYHENIDSRRR